MHSFADVVSFIFIGGFVLLSSFFLLYVFVIKSYNRKQKNSLLEENKNYIELSVNTV